MWGRGCLVGSLLLAVVIGGVTHALCVDDDELLLANVPVGFNATSCLEAAALCGSDALVRDSCPLTCGLCVESTTAQFTAPDNTSLSPSVGVTSTTATATAITGISTRESLLSPSLATAATSSMRAPTEPLIFAPQCSLPYTNLTDYSRGQGFNDGKGNVELCENNPGFPPPAGVNDWGGPGLYRFASAAAGVTMSLTAPSPYSCGTDAAGWQMGPLPVSNDGLVDRRVCFSWGAFPCKYQTTVGVVLCDGFYLYNLPNTPSSCMRYCGSGTGVTPVASTTLLTTTVTTTTPLPSTATVNVSTAASSTLLAPNTGTAIPPLTTTVSTSTPAAPKFDSSTTSEPRRISVSTEATIASPETMPTNSESGVSQISTTTVSPTSLALVTTTVRADSVGSSPAPIIVTTTQLPTLLPTSRDRSTATPVLLVTAEESSKSNFTRTWPIILGVMGGVLLLCMLCMAVAVCRRRSRMSGAVVIFGAKDDAHVYKNPAFEKSPAYDLESVEISSSAPPSVAPTLELVQMRRNTNRYNPMYRNSEFRKSGTYDIDSPDFGLGSSPYAGQLSFVPGSANNRLSGNFDGPAVTFDAVDHAAPAPADESPVMRFYGRPSTSPGYPRGMALREPSELAPPPVAVENDVSPTSRRRSNRLSVVLGSVTDGGRAANRLSIVPGFSTAMNEHDNDDDDDNDDDARELEESEVDDNSGTQAARDVLDALGMHLESTIA